MFEVSSGMFSAPNTVGTILCFKCGVLMTPNAANMCVHCLRSEIDITENLPRRSIITHCPECDRYLSPPKTWIKAELESSGLLSYCLEKLAIGKKVKLVNAEFVWTESHSKRIKVKLTVQKEVIHGAILQQSFIVEYTVQDQMCLSCSKVHANPDQWAAVVQLRQHVAHRRTFFYLEQLILKHDAASRALRIKQMVHGIDFFFDTKSHAEAFVAFVGKVVPIDIHFAEELMSEDTKSNKSIYRFTFSVRISPICHEDLICLPPKVALSLGNFGPIVICTKVAKNITLLDPFTLRLSFFDADKYFRSSFKALLSSRQLVEYIVLDVELISLANNVANSKFKLADAQVARVSDFGKNDNIFTIRTHLGNLLKPGDYALGYDLCRANTNDVELDKYKNVVIPEVILIRKSYREKRYKMQGKSRQWKLKSLNMEVGDSFGYKLEEEELNSGREEFLNDLEEIPEMRAEISFYRNKEHQQSDMASMTDGEDEPVLLEELLANLGLSDKEESTDDRLSLRFPMRNGISAALPFNDRTPVKNIRGNRKINTALQTTRFPAR